MIRPHSIFLLVPIFGTIALNLCCAQTRATQQFNSLVDETRQLVQARMEQYQIPGVAAAVFNQDRTLWLECFGIEDLSEKRAITPGTVFSIQSVSKTVTATAIMMAVDDDRVRIDAPITNYLPDLALNSVFERVPERKITLRHLLNHTAGLTGETTGGNNSNAGNLPFSEYAKTIRQTWLVAPVGTKHLYSNISFDLAGEILQRVYSRPFAKVIAQKLFQPLGMSKSFVDTAESNGLSPHVAQGHSPTYSKLPHYIPMSASGGVRMSIEDAVRFVQFHLNRGRVDGKPLMNPTLFDTMYRRSIRVTSGGDSVWYGLGVNSWIEAGTYAVAHHGAGFGFRCVMKWYPEYGIGVVMMANGFDVAFVDWEATRNVLREMVERRIVKKKRGAVSRAAFTSATPRSFVSDKPPTPRLIPQPFQSDWEQYIGRYRRVYGGGFERSPTAEPEPDGFVSKKDGHLVLEIDGIEERLFEQEPGLFFCENLGEALDLRRKPYTVGNVRLKKIE